MHNVIVPDDLEELAKSLVAALQSGQFLIGVHYADDDGMTRTIHHRFERRQLGDEDVANVDKASRKFFLANGAPDNSPLPRADEFFRSINNEAGE